MRSLLVLGVMTALTSLMLLLIAGHGPWAGEPLWQVSDSHGINTGDIPVLVIWAAGMLAAGLLLRRDDR
ncbi:hypothetical protein [Nocardioides dongkuii]|uniref:hypothetical protein n=1 Tax=Nocardioides dongkuii TaxID=2760089 RepID=UPI0015FCF8EB|nr:hypothetical protein [Nocardioides dongkuii]